MLENTEQIIYEYVKARGSVSFAELQTLLGADFKGDHYLTMKDNENLILWTGMSAEFVKLMSNLLNKGVYKVSEAHILSYAIDGSMLSYPIAKRPNHKYKTLHWLPVVLDLPD